MAMEHICWLQVEVNSWFCNTRPLNFETNYKVRFVTTPIYGGPGHPPPESFEFSNV